MASIITDVASYATLKSDFDRSTAIINDISQFYDQSVTKIYEVEAGPLTSDKAAWIDKLFTVYNLFRIEAGSRYAMPQAKRPITSTTALFSTFITSYHITMTFT